MAKYENGENVSRLECKELLLVHCSIVDNGHQRNSGVFYILVANKLFSQLPYFL